MWAHTVYRSIGRMIRIIKLETKPPTNAKIKLSNLLDKNDNVNSIEFASSSTNCNILKHILEHIWQLDTQYNLLATDLMWKHSYSMSKTHLWGLFN